MNARTIKMPAGTGRASGRVIDWRRWALGVALLALAAGLLAGCGGGGGGPALVTVEFDVLWAERAAAPASVVTGPSSALSVKVTMTHENGTTQTFVVDRPAGAAEILQHVTSPRPFPAGKVRVEFTFYTQAGGTGDVVGRALADVTIRPDGTGLGNVVTRGEVASVVVPPDQIVLVGQTTELGVEVRNREAALVAIAPEAVFWAVRTGGGNLGVVGASVQGLMRGDASVVATVDGVGSSSARVLVRRTPRLIILPRIVPGARVEPLAISQDGTAIVGLADTGEGPEAFRWTEAGGLQRLGKLPGYEAESVAVDVSADGSVVLGMSLNGAQGTLAAFLWTQAGGLQQIPLPPEAESVRPVGLSADGQVVAGIYFYDDGGTPSFNWFMWSSSSGTVVFATAEVDPEPGTWDTPVSLSGDGCTVIANIVHFEVDPSEPEGAHLYRFPSPAVNVGTDRITHYQLTPDPQTHGTTTYLLASYHAVSHDGTVVGGYMRRFADGGDTPMLWRADTGLMEISTGWFGLVNAVSPDGTHAGGGNYDAGSAFLWDTQRGSSTIGELVQRLDDQYGTDLSQEFFDQGGGLPSMIYGISGDNSKITGTAGPALQGQPCAGFLLELP